ncbi:MAG: cytochrome c [Steroidobacteraceae bacterium]
MTGISNWPPRMAAITGLALAASIAFAGDASKTAATGAAPRPLTQPLSLVDLMRASIEIPADGLWAAAGADKLSEEDWQLADQDAVNLIAATTLIASAGTGKNDRKWVAHADWQSWVREMEKTALAIRAAVKAEDQKNLAAVADQLQQICEACHTKYRPQTPSDGASRYPFYPKRELVK